jgi:plastocyanin
MGSSSSGKRVWIVASAALALATCGDSKPSGGGGHLGSVQIALVTTTNGHSYRLRNASFDVNGPTHVTLSSETDPTATDLTANVAPGSYVVTLANGWQLEREDPSGPVIVQATLVSPNPTAALTVTAAHTTSVAFQFSTDGVPITLGTIDISIQVTEVDGGQTSSPQLSATLDHSVVTELGTSNTVTVTLTATNGFAGPVTLAGTLASTDGSTLDGWALSFDATTVNVPLNGSATALVTITIPTLNRGLSANVNITATSAAGVANAATTVSVANQYTIDVAVDGSGQCVYPPVGTIELNVGTEIRWLNDGASAGFIIHSDGAPAGCPHQNTGLLTFPGSSYSCTLTAPWAQFHWYCHSPGPDLPGLEISSEALP